MEKWFQCICNNLEQILIITNHKCLGQKGKKVSVRKQKKLSRGGVIKKGLQTYLKTEILRLVTSLWNRLRQHPTLTKKLTNI